MLQPIELFLVNRKVVWQIVYSVFYSIELEFVCRKRMLSFYLKASLSMVVVAEQLNMPAFHSQSGEETE